MEKTDTELRANVSEPMISKPLPCSKQESKYELWKPGRLNLAPLELFFRRVITSLLNKLTPENFSRLAEKMKTSSINTPTRMQQVVEMIHKKAIVEWRFRALYAKLCDLMQDVKVVNERGVVKLFKLDLIAHCNTFFQNSSYEKFENIRKEYEKKKCLYFDQEMKKSLMRECEENEREFRRKSIGNCQFIGELFKVHLIHPKIIFLILDQLLKQNGNMAVESFCALLTTIGHFYEEKINELPAVYFNKLESFLPSNVISLRTRFMIEDVLHLKKNSWRPRRRLELPKTLLLIEQEMIEEEKNQKLAESMSRPDYVLKRNVCADGGRASVEFPFDLHRLSNFCQNNTQQQQQQQYPVYGNSSALTTHYTDEQQLLAKAMTMIRENRIELENPDIAEAITPAYGNSSARTAMTNMPIVYEIPHNTQQQQQQQYPVYGNSSALTTHYTDEQQLLAKAMAMIRENRIELENPDTAAAITPAYGNSSARTAMTNMPIVYEIPHYTQQQQQQQYPVYGNSSALTTHCTQQQQQWQQQQAAKAPTTNRINPIELEDPDIAEAITPAYGNSSARTAMTNMPIVYEIPHYTQQQQQQQYPVYGNSSALTTHCTQQQQQWQQQQAAKAPTTNRINPIELEDPDIAEAITPAYGNSSARTAMTNMPIVYEIPHNTQQQQQQQYPVYGNSSALTTHYTDEQQLLAKAMTMIRENRIELENPDIAEAITPAYGNSSARTAMTNMPIVYEIPHNTQQQQQQQYPVYGNSSALTTHCTQQQQAAKAPTENRIELMNPNTGEAITPAYGNSSARTAMANMPIVYEIPQYTQQQQQQQYPVYGNSSALTTHYTHQQQQWQQLVAKAPTTNRINPIELEDPDIAEAITQVYGDPSALTAMTNMPSPPIAYGIPHYTQQQQQQQYPVYGNSSALTTHYTHQQQQQQQRQAEKAQQQQQQQQQAAIATTENRKNPIKIVNPNTGKEITPVYVNSSALTTHYTHQQQQQQQQ